MQKKRCPVCYIKNKYQRTSRGGHLFKIRITLSNLCLNCIWNCRKKQGKKEQKAITKQINKKLNTVDFPKKSPEKVCCVGGTCRAILNIVNYHFNKQENNRIITREEFDKILKILTKHDITSRNYILKLCPDRVHTIIPGMMVVKEIMDRLNCKELWVSRYGVREGYLCKNFLMTGSTQEVTK